MQRLKEIIKRFLLWIGATVMLLCMGCAKAPVADAAAQKNTEQIVEMASTDGKQTKGPLRARLGAPDSCVVEIPMPDERIRVSVDAEVILPASDQISIYPVSAADFSQELAERAYRYFCGDTIMYPASGRLTRDWYASEIARMQKNLAEDALDASARQSAEGYLALLAEEIAAAPESAGEPVEHVRFDAGQADGGGQYACFNAIEFAAPQPGKRFSVVNDTTYAVDGVQYNVDGFKTIAPRSGALLEYCDTSLYQGDFSHVRRIADDARAEHMVLTPGQARARAQSILDDLALNDLSIEGVYAVSNAAEAEATGRETQYAYCITACRTVDRIPVRTADYASYVGDPVDGFEWLYERIIIGINDGGVVRFSWRAPLSVGDIEVADPSLLPFDEIMRVFHAVISTANNAGVQALSADASLSVSVERIELCLQRVSRQGSVDSGLLCPVWSFYGNTERVSATGDVADWSAAPIETNGLIYPLLSINAVDGSVIIANEGY